MKTHRLRRTLALLALCAALVSTLIVPASAAAFHDVPASHWAAGEISRCVEHGFFQGQAPGHFGLGESMTRSAFTVVMSRFFGWETPKPASPTYPDIPENAWYSGAVQAAFDHGALTRQRNTFRPTDPITREEMTVMLLRAMGYSDLAGLSAERPCPFEDVSKNAGYITLAYHLGLMNGTSATTFAPERPATREQVAVIFMRLYDKLHAPSPAKLSMISPEEPLPELSGISAAAIPAGHLMSISGVPTLQEAADAETIDSLRIAVQEGGTDVLLYVTVSSNLMDSKKSIAETSAALAQMVTDGGYDGLVMDVPRLRESYASRLAQLVQATGTALGENAFFLMTEAPSRDVSAPLYNGYNFPVLAESADGLVLRFQTTESRKSGFTTAPLQTPEEIYHTLLTLKEQGVPSGKIALLLTSTAVYRKGSTLVTDHLSPEEFQLMLESGEMTAHYSERYACAYLSGSAENNASHSVWYLDGRSAAERVQLLRFFGGGQIFLTNANCTAPDFFSGLK